MSAKAAEVERRLQEAARKKKGAKPNYAKPAAGAVMAVIIAYLFYAFLTPVQPVFGEDGVRELSDADFSSATKEPTFVMFYAPWCGHCKALKPTWAEAAALPAEERGGFTFAKADCTGPASRTCKKYGATGYPTLMLVHGSDSATHEAGRDLEALTTAAKNGIAAARKAAEERKVKEAEEEAARIKAEAESPVTFLDDSTYSEALKGKQHLIKFYAPWCGHCKALAPTWDELAKDEEIAGKDVVVAKADCTGKARALCAEYKVKGFPEIYLVNGTSKVKYEGGREKDPIKEFALKGVKKALAERNAAKRKEKEERIQREKEEEASPVTYLSDLDFSTASFQKRPHLIKFFAPWCGHCKRLAPVWEELAVDEEVTGKVTVAKADCTGKAKRACKLHEVTGYPVIKLVDGKKSLVWEGERTFDALKELALLGVEAGKAKQEVYLAEKKLKEEEEARAAELAEANSKVVRLTDDTYKDVVAQLPHFVKFYAPWCGHCKALAPVWEELSTQEFANGVKIAKADCTGKAAGFCKEHGVEGYPTLKLVKGADAKDYQGGRDLESLVEFAAAGWKD